MKNNLPTNVGIITFNSPTSVTQFRDKEIFIAGTFIVEQDFNFKDCKIYMGENAKIVVSGAEFSITGTNVNYQRFIKSCDPNKFWDGIYVNATGSSNSSLYIANYTPFMNNENLKFSNSKNGIVLTSNPFTYISDVHFDRNEKVLNVKANNNVSNEIELNNSKIECSSPLISSTNVLYYPLNAVKITDNKVSNISNPLISIVGVEFFGSGGNLEINNSSVYLYTNTYKDFYNDFYMPGIAKNHYGINITGKNTTDNSAIQYVKSDEETFINNSTSIIVTKDIDFQMDHFRVNKDFLGNYYSGVGGSFMRINNSLGNINIASSLSVAGISEIYNIPGAFNIYNAPFVTIDNIYMDLEFQGVGVNTYNNKLNTNSAAIYIDNYDLQTYYTTPINITNNTIKHAKNGIIANFTAIDILNNTIEDMNDLTAPPSTCYPYPPCPPIPGWGIKAINCNATVIENKIKNNINQYSIQPKTNESIVGIELIN